MKKITIICCLFVSTLGFAQILEDFDGGVLPAIGFSNGSGSAAIVSDPTGGGKGNVLEVITAAAGDPWQQAEITFANGNLDLSTAVKTVSIDWYSVAPFGALIRADGGLAGAAHSVAQAAHPGGGWQTLVFDFNSPQDGSGVPSGVYTQLFLFNNWGYGIPTGSWPCGTNSCTPKTTYVDVIREPGVMGPITTTWTGTTNTNWDTASNWSNGVPTTGVNAIIQNVTNKPIASGAVIVNDMLIEAGTALTVLGTVTNSGVITVASGASFIAKTSVSGTVTYVRNLISSNWHYISSPVIGQNVDDFVAASGLQSGGTVVSFCNFDTAANDWNFYPNGTSSTDVLNDGQGYIVNLTAASGNVTFSGSMNTGNETIALATTGEGYNLLGNPYPSYLDSNAMLTASSGALLSQTIWLWDQSAQVYETKVAADNFQIAPGQGFFIQSNGAAGNVAITEAFQSHQGTDTFLRSDNRTEVYLTVSNSSSTNACKIYYVGGTTTDFDNGFDGPKFRAFPEPLSIYTRLVTNGFGRDYGVQSLPNDDYENLVVPLGINGIAGEELSISASTINLPVGIDIYLQDNEFNTFTLLDETTEYTFTPTTDLEGIGRFYIYTSSDALSITENTLVSQLQIYTTDSPKEVIIKGQLYDTTIAMLYDLQGKLILSEKLNQSSNTNTLDISELSSGLYIVKVDSGAHSKTQKVMIK